MDGASNNFTMMAHLETLLESRGICFDAHDRQIVCYAHCIDLASKAAIGKLPNEALLNEDDDAILRNPITLARAVVRSIRGSNLRREAFNDCINDGNSKGWFKCGSKAVTVKPLQLLRDVQTRWDSCFRMLERLRMLRLVCVSVLKLSFI
jgi:hypothetical protein